MPRIQALAQSVAHRPGVIAVAMGPDALLVEPDSALVLRLDGRARLIWDLLDGQSSVRQIAHEIAEVYRAPVDVVEADVLEVVARLLEAGLVRTPIEGSPTGTATTSDHHTEVSGVSGAVSGLDSERGVPLVLAAGQSACYQSFSAREWDGINAIRTGDVVLGVRSNNAATRAAVQAALSPWLVDGFDVDANFSVRGPSPDDPSGRASLALVHRDCALVGRHRLLSDALDQLLVEIAAAADEIRPCGRAWVRTAVVVDDAGRAVLIPT